ncbi:MAG: NAD(P)H-dependent oxidoreductase subunit E [Betaproteobacteria bacterium]|nr:NAD(P)H-dependent oxidoreductase subunit E [Betaproteobacteria bacterium]
MHEKERAPTPEQAARHAITRYHHDPSCLVQILHDVQDALGWLPPPALTAIAETLGISRAHVEGVAGFYSFFHLEPVGQYRIFFSDNITDRMLGAPKLMAMMCRILNVEPGHRSADGAVTVGTTSCTGMCDQGPALLVNGFPVTRLTQERIREICNLIAARAPVKEWPKEFFLVENNIQRSDQLLKFRLDPGSALKAAVAKGRDGLLAEIHQSNLRGRGGAGFTTATKWEAAKKAPGPERFVVCNADEGEPGTFKDRVLLTSYADHVIEGMTLCAYAIGAQRGFIYLRYEYRYLVPHLEAVLRQRRTLGLLGKNILRQADFDFDVEIRLGAGAYVCGEETALIESLEGKRGTPRIRPPFPVTCGYMGKPTVVNNVETLAKTCLVLAESADEFAATGTPQSSGTKLLSISGDCARPGIYEYPFGIGIAQILEDCGASNVQAVQVGGASGTCLAPYEFHRRIAFENVSTAGSFMIFGINRDMFEVARNFVHFFAHESCGFCTPCRVGTSLLKNLMDKMHNNKGANYDLSEIERLTDILKTSSHCGLGLSAGNPVITTMSKFTDVYVKRLQPFEFEPEFDLDKALARARQITHRDDTEAHFQDEREILS